MEKTQEAEADNWEVKVETKALNDGSLCGYDSLHSLLSANLKPELYLFFLFFFLGLSTSALFFFFLIYMNQFHWSNGFLILNDGWVCSPIGLVMMMMMVGSDRGSDDDGGWV